MGAPKKRSVVLQGHPTSVTVEDIFWCQLKIMATKRGVSLNVLLGQIDEARGDQNLSSAARVFVVENLLKDQ